MNEQLSFTYIKKIDNYSPLFDVRLELGYENIKYEPSIEELLQGQSVRNTIKSYISDFYHISTLVNRLDTGGVGDYLTEMRDNLELREHLSHVADNLDYIETETGKYKQSFLVYSYLWTSDAKSMFDSFLTEEEEKEQNAQKAA